MAVQLPHRKCKSPMSQMNVVPYIDVMLVLLIIFMVTAPMLSTGEIEIPSAGISNKAPEKNIRISIGINKSIELTDINGKTTVVTINQLVEQVKAMQNGDENIAVVIAADKKVEYDHVIQVLSLLHENGFKRAGLLTMDKSQSP